MSKGFDRLFDNISPDKISRAGEKTDSGLACPRCGSTNFCSSGAA